MSDSEGESNEKHLKIVIVGDGSSGKVRNKKYKTLVEIYFIRHRLQHDILRINSKNNIIKH